MSRQYKPTGLIRLTRAYSNKSKSKSRPSKYNPKFGGRAIADERSDKHSISLTNFNLFLRSRLLDLGLKSTKSSVLKTIEIGELQYDTHLTNFMAQVLDLPDNQYYSEHTPEYAVFLRHAPTLPHLGILRTLQSHKNGGALTQNLMRQCFENYVRDKEGLDTLHRTLGSSKVLANMTHPEEWYPKARAMKRKWIFHVGPTNSGKTYTALQRLQNAKSGIFAGPLRLLTREIYERFKAAGRPCNLVTGEEIIYEMDDFGNKASISASTVEMVDLQTKVDVAVIDEIQMIEDKDRGWAWTAALLGLQCDELHLCGEERAVAVLSAIAKSLGDEVVINTYNRLSPLEVQSSSLEGSLSKIRKQDAVVAFSRRKIHLLKREIENQTNHKCVVIYGALPPETRSTQAKLFNDPESGYDVLVASDAIGMGLNLAIKRVVFESSVKFNGTDVVRIDPSSMKQIAGRAGRYRAAGDTATDDNKLGLVTTLNKVDHSHLVACMASSSEPIKYAGLMPPDALMDKFAADYPTMSYDLIVEKFYTFALASEHYTTCSLRQQIEVARSVGMIDGLTLPENITIGTAPAKSERPGVEQAMTMFGKSIASGTPISLLDIPDFSLLVKGGNVPARMTLDGLEELHVLVILYLWMSYRFPAVLYDRAGAIELNNLIQSSISGILSDW
ncbi:P-loop containing nucleoside triphosphate hydrolase protein [Lipomyces arxii]|uniref:P-loop containing nucleoside triphosphate hydrolase protein n=1 Tax=Lipomyces arxii TaxID=56418 RepID=UPI0034CFD3FA